MFRKRLDRPIFQGSKKEPETVFDFEKLAKQKEKILERCVYCGCKDDLEFVNEYGEIKIVMKK